MELSKSLLESYLRHTRVLIEKGRFDLKDIKTANSLRLARKELTKLEKRIKDDRH